jgi:hypothetical protein
MLYFTAEKIIVVVLPFHYKQTIQCNMIGFRKRIDPAASTSPPKTHT